MNNKTYSILTKNMINNYEHNGSVPENCFCPVCNVHMNRIKRPFDTLDTQQEYFATATTDGIKDRQFPDRLQTLHTNVQSTMNHSERLLKLNPYPVLDTDPTLDVHFSHRLYRSRYTIGKKIKNYKTQSFEVDPIKKPNKVFQYHNNVRKWEENENNGDQVELKNNDKFINKAIKKHDKHRKQSSIHCQHKVLPTVPLKSLISINFIPEAGGLLSNINCNLNNHNPINENFKDIPKPKIINNHSQIPTVMPVETKDTIKTMKHVKDTMTNKEIKEGEDININDYKSPKTEIPNKNDIFEKNQEKLYEKNIKILNLKTRRRVDTTNNTTVFSFNSWNNNNHLLHSSFALKTENAQKITKSSIVEKNVYKNVKRDLITDDPKKLAFDTPKQKINPEHHSALRLSLFSNTPPYIRFSSHAIKGESFPLLLQKLLKWKLSSITPIVVRRTIQNSGFKLVRSEHSLVNNANDPSIIINQSNQNAISLRNYCGITPSIVDAFCGAVPTPNELMMLPRSQSNDWIGTWGKHMKSLCFKTLHEQQKLNHFPGTFQIGRKDRLWRNLHRLMLKYGKDQFGFIPTSYILPQESRLLRQVWEKNDEDKWIVKPPASARGTGIRVISKWNQIPKKVPLVVQRYIDNPYLINETKFDLRLYILITSINPLRLYLYDNGLVRFASVKYSSDLTTISDRYMHLTNYSINRLNSQYTQNEDADACQGHKWTLRSLWTYMEKERKVEVKKLWDSLADLVVKTVISGESPMNQMCRSNLSNRYNAYELFGIDVLFDEYLKPWILEVNISPSLHSSSPLDLAVKGPLVKDLMNMVGYHIPNKMSPGTHSTLLKLLGMNSPLCYDKRLYTFNLSVKEREKQEYYTHIESREEYIDSILDELLPDDVRYLIVYEDELTQIGSFQKVFPTTSSYKYHQYFDGPRYYNMLCDAWECKYGIKRDEGIAVLEKLCQLKVHLEVPEIDEEQLKSCEILQNTQMKVEKMFEKSGGDKIDDDHQAVIR